MPPVFARVVFYRDEHGRIREARVEGTDAEALDRLVRAYAALERRCEASRLRWEARHATFTDAQVDPGQVSEAAGGRKSQAGYPWEGPRFSFALLLGETPVWSGPGSLTLTLPDGSGRCRFCGHYREAPAVAYCLGCDRSGRDRAIPKGAPRTAAKRPAGGKGSKLKGGVGG